MRKSLFPWQDECLEHWADNKYTGIVHVVTGAGKTVLALGAIEALEKKLAAERRTSLRAKIVVPRVFLAFQWMKALQEELQVEREQIGCYSGLHKDAHERKYMIYVINSARFSLPKHILNDFQKGFAVFLIADECHHYSTGENSRIFDFTRFLQEENLYFSLGLSATPETTYFEQKIRTALGLEIYWYGFAEALQGNIISDFVVYNVKVPFQPDELTAYEELSNRFSMAINKLMSMYPSAKRFSRSNFFSMLRQLISQTKHPALAATARSILLYAYQRKEIVYLAKERVSCVRNLIRRSPSQAKIILFGERIEMMERIYADLLKLYPGRVGIYHSRMNESQRKRMLRQYEDGSTRILLSCKALDEGLNVPAADIGIVVSSTGSRRQRIQRLGRILRRTNDKEKAYLYYLFVNESNEEREMLSDLSADCPMHHLAYQAEAEFFIDDEYDTLANRVFTALPDEQDEKVIDEIMRSLDIGVIRCDWLMTEDQCLDKIKTASSKAERNYYVTMLLLIRAKD